jgi:hypothetical protein
MEVEGSSKEHIKALRWISCFVGFFQSSLSEPISLVSLLLKGILHSNAERIPVCACCSCLRPSRRSGHLTAVHVCPSISRHSASLTLYRTLMSLHIDDSSLNRAACTGRYV